jgi:heme exporter protein B
LPLVVISPLLALFVDLDSAALPTLVLGLLLGTPAMSLVGAIAAALSLGARRPGVVMTLLVLPLYLPPLIFGTGAVEASLTGEGARAHLLLLAALTVAALPLAPLAAAAALRQVLD